MVYLECEMIVVFLGLRKGNCRNIIGGNIAAVLRAVVTYNKDLKGAKSLPVGVLEEISKFSQNL